MLDDETEAFCARCRRSTPVEAMRLWTTRERVRTLARTASPGVTPSALPPLPRDRPPGPRAAAEPSSPGSMGLADAGLRPAAFRYASVTRADAVCAACHDRLQRGAALDGPERWRTWLTFAGFLLIAALLVWGVPALMPNLIAAFWRNGAGGR